MASELDPPADTEKYQGRRNVPSPLLPPAPPVTSKTVKHHTTAGTMSDRQLARVLGLEDEEAYRPLPASPACLPALSGDAP